MTEEVEKTEVPEEEEKEKPEENGTKETEEKTKIDVNVDLGGLLKEINELKSTIGEMVKMNEQEKAAMKKAEEITKEVVKEKMENKTKGIVKTNVEEISDDFTGLVIEKAEVGKGFQIWKDYSKDTSGKLKRLAR